jgi:alkylhydroperoxidase family enzyme
MTTFPIHTIESAPEHSKPALQQFQSAFGMIPNLIGAMSTSPLLTDSLVGLFGKVHGGSFTEAQVQIILLTDAVTNVSTWAVAFHTALALKEGIDPADVQAIREGRLPKDRKFAALSALAKTMIEKRGRLNDEEVNRFLAAGFGKDHLLEVIAAVAASTITNYTSSITRPPVDRFRLTPGPAKNTGRLWCHHGIGRHQADRSRQRGPRCRSWSTDLHTRSGRAVGRS